MSTTFIESVILQALASFHIVIKTTNINIVNRILANCPIFDSQLIPLISGLYNIMPICVVRIWRQS